VRQSPSQRSIREGVQSELRQSVRSGVTASSRSNNIWVGDEGARAAVDQLSRDIGMEPLNGGPFEYAAIEEEFAKMLVAMVRDAGNGLLSYRFATPENF
jgi:8-hydroxy-5-deazaflavin:NADPH oxidoreductase